MSTRVRDVVMQHLGELRHEPTEKRIRGLVGDRTVVDSRRALLVWEPKRVVPTYAVPIDDVSGEIVAAPATPATEPEGVGAMGAPHLGDRPVFDPSIPFAVHTVDGEALVIRPAGGGRELQAFRPADATLADHVLLDFAGFDAWLEEDEPNVGHPRDPFHRVDILHGSEHVRVEIGGTVVAETTSPYVLFEPPLPVRYYFAVGDVRMDLLRPSDHRSSCAYKGHATYWSALDEPDVAWSYRQPLREAAEITDRIAFFNERVDVVVDGTPLSRPITPWSRR